ncbi:hypothetical protein D3C79_753210 [compost metagenome]
MKAEHVGQRAVDTGEFTDHVEGLRPAGAQPAEVAGDAQGQQAAVADGIALGLGRAALAVALDCGAGELTGQFPRDLQRGRWSAVQRWRSLAL